MLVVQTVFELTSDDDGFSFQDGVLSYNVTGFLAFQPGNHTLTVRASDGDGEHEFTWNFTMDPTAGQEEGGIDPLLVVLGVAGLVGLALLTGVATVLYLVLAKGYTWRKFQVRFPRLMGLVAFYVPLVVAVVGVLAGLVYATSAEHKIRFLVEYVLVAGAFTATAPLAVQTLRGHGLRLAQEKAFAQMLFEMADAMRGGIDPVKAVRELGQNPTGPLKNQLRVAADALGLGRPFGEVMQQFARNTGSSLIQRYSRLVTEAASAGGDISLVIYRAAKDMDELTKIATERRQKMRGPVMTMYIAFGVLFLITATLIDFAPNLAETDLSGLFGDGVGAAGGAGLDVAAFEQKFFHLLLVASFGTGLLVGAFTEGNVRHGLHHMLLMVGVSVVAYPLFVV